MEQPLGTAVGSGAVLSRMLKPPCSIAASDTRSIKCDALNILSGESRFCGVAEAPATPALPSYVVKPWGGVLQLKTITQTLRMLVGQTLGATVKLPDAESLIESMLAPLGVPESEESASSTASGANASLPRPVSSSSLPPPPVLPEGEIPQVDVANQNQPLVYRKPGARRSCHSNLESGLVHRPSRRRLNHQPGWEEGGRVQLSLHACCP